MNLAETAKIIGGSLTAEMLVFPARVLAVLVPVVKLHSRSADHWDVSGPTPPCGFRPAVDAAMSAAWPDLTILAAIAGCHALNDAWHRTDETAHPAEYHALSAGADWFEGRAFHTDPRSHDKAIEAIRFALALEEADTFPSNMHSLTEIIGTHLFSLARFHGFGADAGKGGGA